MNMLTYCKTEVALRLVLRELVVWRSFKTSITLSLRTFS